jgi:transposase
VVARTARQALQEQRYDQGDQLLPKPLGRIYRFLDDGRLCMSNNAAERELRAVAVGRRNWTFAGSDEGGRRAAAVYTLIATAKLNDIDPQAWLADVLARLPDHPARRIHELLPWNWHPQNVAHAA